MMQKNKKPSGQRVGKSKAGKANNQRNRIVEKRKRVPGFHITEDGRQFAWKGRQHGGYRTGNAKKPPPFLWGGVERRTFVAESELARSDVFSP